MGASEVLIDSCHECAVVWLDAAELGLMARLYQRVERNIEQRRREVEQHLRERDRTFDALKAIYAVRRGRHYARADFGRLVGKSLLVDFVATGLRFLV